MRRADQRALAQDGHLEQRYSTSSSLWETKMTVMPWDASLFRVANSFSFCGWLMPVVGSSRIRTRAPNQSRRRISSCWRSPTVRVST